VFSCLGLELSIPRLSLLSILVGGKILVQAPLILGRWQDLGPGLRIMSDVSDKSTGEVRRGKPGLGVTGVGRLCKTIAQASSYLVTYMW